MNTVIRNATLVNEGKISVNDVFIVNNRIENISAQINLPPNLRYREINAEGLYVMPGAIDDQVHFREPGQIHKADIFSESKAAVAGGITSFMDMPNTIPNVLTQELLHEKYEIASRKSLANYSFFMGINRDNLEEALKTNTENVCGITDDGLYFTNNEGILANYPDFLEKLFSRTNTLVALHSEDDSIIKKNEDIYRERYGNDIPFKYHALIRSEDACFHATERVLRIAQKHNNRLHLFHISTLREASLFGNTMAVREKRITAEACIHHLWFSDRDYDLLGPNLKWNPAVKTEKDRIGLFQSLLDNKLDIIATDHAPHTVREKTGNYFDVSSGGPMVQHALPAMLEFYHQKKIGLETIVDKMCHNVAELYRIKDRGFIREGYFADLVLLDLNNPWAVTPDNLLYKCKWSPFINQTFRSQIAYTFVNGNLVYALGSFTDGIKGQRMKFEKIR